jgi:hypothetical protein
MKKPIFVSRKKGEKNTLPSYPTTLLLDPQPSSVPSNASSSFPRLCISDSGRILTELGQKAPSEKNVKAQSTRMRCTTRVSFKIRLSSILGSSLSTSVKSMIDTKYISILISNMVPPMARNAVTITELMEMVQNYVTDRNDVTPECEFMGDTVEQFEKVFQRAKRQCRQR